jgi:hypothetical protein
MQLMGGNSREEKIRALKRFLQLKRTSRYMMRISGGKHSKHMQQNFIAKDLCRRIRDTETPTAAERAVSVFFGRQEKDNHARKVFV